MNPDLPVGFTCGWVLRLLGEPGSRQLDFNAGARAAGKPEGVWQGLKMPWGEESTDWQHIAVCRSPEEVRLYRNGKLLGKRSVKGLLLVPAPTDLYLGVRANAYMDRRVSAGYRAFRAASEVRYTGEFTPPAEFRPSPGDLVVLDFTTGALADRTGKGHDGRLAGGKWQEETGTAVVGGGPPGGKEPAGPMPGSSPGKPGDGLVGVDVGVSPDRWGGFTDDKVGDTIKVRGMCEGFKDGKVLVGFADRYHGYRPSVPAPELAREYKADPGAADRKYRGKLVVVEGVLAEKGTDGLILSATKPPAPPSGAARKPAPALLKEKADLVVTAQAFFAEYERDGEAASAKYKGKVVELSGAIVSFAATEFHDPMLEIGKDTGTRGVVCRMAEEEPWASLAVGQQVRLRGRVSLMGGPFPEECVVVEKGPNPAVRVTAEQLAAECAADREALNEKYEEKPLLVTGEVTAREEDRDAETVKIVLKGNDRVKVSFSFNFAPHLADGIHVGMKVKAACRYGFAEREEVRLGEGYFIFGPEPTAEPPAAPAGGKPTPPPGMKEPAGRAEDREKALALLRGRGVGLSPDPENPDGAVRSVTFSEKQFTPEAAQALRHLTGVQEVTFYMAQIPEGGLRHLKDLAGLRAVRITACEASPEALKEIAEVRPLRELEVQSLLPDEVLAGFKSLENLESLTINNPVTTDAGLASLKDLPKLRTLKLTGEGITLAGVKGLGHLRHLEVMWDGRKDVNHLADLAGLETLIIQGGFSTGPEDDAKVGARELAGLGKLASLKELWVLRAEAKDADFAPLAGLKGLEALQVNGSGYSGSWVGHLARLERFHTLSLGGDDLTAEGLQALKGLTRLETLEVTSHMAAGTWLKQLDGKKLRLLSVSSARLTDADVRALPDLPALRTLRVMGDLGDGVVPAVSRFRTLEKLTVRGGKFTGKDLGGLAELPLKGLELFGPGVGDEAMKEVKKLRNLESLTIAGTMVTDAGLKELHGMPKLRTLIDEGNLTSPEGLAAAEKAIPGLRVNPPGPFLD